MPTSTNPNIGARGRTEIVTEIWSIVEIPLPGPDGEESLQLKFQGFSTKSGQNRG